MFRQACCCCLKTAENHDEIPTNDTSCGGVNNKSFETWEPATQRKTSSSTLEIQPKLSTSDNSSCESIKLSKMDLNLNIFENDRFSDMSETIHKNNTRNLSTE